MEAAGTGFGETAEVHQHGLAILDQMRHGGLPGVGMAEEIVDAEAAIRIAHAVAFGEAVCERGLIAHEMPVELAAEKIEELVRLDGAERNVGPGDHLDA